MIVLFYSALAVLSFGWAAWRGRPDVYHYATDNHSHFVLSPLVGVAFGLTMVFLSRLAVHSMEWARVLHREFHAVVHELSAKEILLLAATSSIGEELFFRGALLPVVGVVPSSALFAAMHVRPHARFLPWTIMSFFLGIAMGWLYIKLGDLGAPIAAHFTINLLNLNYIAKTELPGS
jgi:membrane protease YdiL (CAAX protease family)